MMMEFVPSREVLLVMYEQATLVMVWCDEIGSISLFGTARWRSGRYD